MKRNVCRKRNCEESRKRVKGRKKLERDHGELGSTAAGRCRADHAQRCLGCHWRHELRRRHGQLGCNDVQKVTVLARGAGGGSLGWVEAQQPLANGQTRHDNSRRATKSAPPGQMHVPSSARHRRRPVQGTAPPTSSLATEGRWVSSPAGLSRLCEGSRLECQATAHPPTHGKQRLCNAPPVTRNQTKIQHSGGYGSPRPSRRCPGTRGAHIFAPKSRAHTHTHAGRTNLATPLPWACQTP